MTRVDPGGTVGILGGGQLGRMLALAARPLGYRVHVLDPDPSCAARPIVEKTITGAFDDAARAGELAAACDVVTLEIEKIGQAALAAAAAHAPVRPSAAVLAVVQDRVTQKRWLDGRGFPVTPWREVASVAELAAAAEALGRGCFVKSAHGGYDGRGQGRVSPGDDFAAIWARAGGGRAVVEASVDLEAEISTFVARRPSGETAVYAPAFNHHEHHILVWSVLPAPIAPALSRRAQELARDIAVALDVVGPLVVEMFVSRDGRLLVNELAPRPHNSYHESEIACATSQFEQTIRAVCDLPLGSTEIVRPAAIHNLLGDLWRDGRSPNFAAALALPGVRVFLYGKGDPRPARKMGHLAASGASAEEAVARVQAAYAALGS